MCLPMPYQSPHDFLLEHVPSNIYARPFARIQDALGPFYVTGLELKIYVTVHDLDFSVQVALAAKFAVVFSGQSCHPNIGVICRNSKKRLSVQRRIGFCLQITLVKITPVLNSTHYSFRAPEREQRGIKLRKL